MRRKLGLPVAEDGDSASGPPTLERARQRLGGRASTSAFAGEVVTVAGSGGRGVVVYASEDECDVFLEAGFVKRTRRGDVLSAPCEADSPLNELSAEARLFAGLREGSRVRFETPADGMCDGVMFEKCRYGGLVAKDDGVIVAVGFRKLWPVSRGGES